MGKSIIQSYASCILRYRFSLYQIRLLVAIISNFQELLYEKKLVDINLEDEIKEPYVTCDISMADMVGEDIKINYTYIINDLSKLAGKTLSYKTTHESATISLISKIVYNYGKGNFLVDLPKESIIALFDFSAGFRRVELGTILNLSRAQSVRLYLLISGQNNITYNIYDLKEQLGCGQYSNSLFIKKILEPAKRELDAKSPYSFTYNLIFEKPAGKGRSHIQNIAIITKRQENIINKQLENKLDVYQKSHKYPKHFCITKPVNNLLMNTYGFTKKEIHNNLDLLLTAEESFDLLDLLNKISSSKAFQKAKSRKAYIIGTIKKAVNYD